MKKTGEKQIRRHSDGSIDTAYYQAAGRLKRSQQSFRLLSLVRRIFQGGAAIIPARSRHGISLPAHMMPLALPC